jgi:hypothetical protein
VAEQEKGVAILEPRGRWQLLNCLPVPRNAKHTEPIVAAKIGLLHGAPGILGVWGEQSFDSNKVQAPECLLTDLDLLHESEIRGFQEAALLSARHLA